MSEHLIIIETCRIEWICEACKLHPMHLVAELIEEKQRTTQPFSMLLHQCSCGAQRWLPGKYPKTLTIHKELPYAQTQISSPTAPASQGS